MRRKRLYGLQPLAVLAAVLLVGSVHGATEPRTCTYTDTECSASERCYQGCQNGVRYTLDDGILRYERFSTSNCVGTGTQIPLGRVTIGECRSWGKGSFLVSAGSRALGGETGSVVLPLLLAAVPLLASVLS
uniref:Uncharacterized protein n=1 Tax=Chromera velia CCMP2878 TaxID=1169474 RepID=A0A0G4HHI0_9ALVE|eukprot:Cvel_27498.t1-p1 / transcript=Cvel_27498.t1 / gene=Cvel_27498 / organism=Chromera_velia_CCMP2878 / gene_product=hypothetical protein / transcript_product=hypothetical protein / location=Cvel_scaffold3440:5703-6528(+) / protein_length=131 / sequence_SO=supercontig / SO=protein_coding / is_pseudo=false